MVLLYTNSSRSNSVLQIASATHNIFAYRFTCPKTGVAHHDCDDDGETAAGGRLAELLRLMPADGVAVVVTRHFGGILLGQLLALHLELFLSSAQF